MDKRFVEVVFDIHVDKGFFYRIPTLLRPMTSIGKRVLVSFGRRRMIGYVVGLRSRVDLDGIKDIIDVIDDDPLFDRRRLALYRYISSHYLSPLGEVIKTAHSGEAQTRVDRLFYLTPSGKIHLQGKRIDNLSSSILSFIDKRGKTSIRTICNSLKGSAVYATLASLKKKGLIGEESIIKGGGLKKRGFALFTGNDRGDIHDLLTSIAKKAPVEAAILKRVIYDGEVPLNILKEEFKYPNLPLKRLQEKGLIEIRYRAVSRYWEDEPLKTYEGVLTDEQMNALNEIKRGLTEKGKTFLLYGVTGSGKTEVYLRAMEETVRKGMKALFLAPEIALASRLSRYILSRFKRVALFHSNLSARERLEQWSLIKRGEVDIVAGARSAVFAPLHNIGLIIVDEEHDPAYKQEEGVRYNARDLALLLGRVYKSVVLLGSATPSIESFKNALEGGMKYIELSKRVDDKPLPSVSIIDMRKEKGAVISSTLLQAIGERLERKEQVILFLNRKGYSPFILCKDCGFVYRCPDCLISLTYYKTKRFLRCHYCGHTQDAPEYCDICHGYRISPMGTGIDKVIDVVERAFKGVRIERMDREIVRRGRKVWDEFDRGEIDILIGTQIITKGYHFPYVTLVGVILGDQSLNLPDFRATERTFQLLTQVAGRAGRGEEPGEVYIQTYNPEEYCFKKVVNHDYKGFYREEIVFREEAWYPPFSRIVNILWEGEDNDSVSSEARNFKERAVDLGGDRDDINILGPAPAFYIRLRKKYRWQMIIKGKDTARLNAFIKEVASDYRPKGKVKMIIDVDPIHLL